VSEAGNFEGRSILVRAGSDDDPPELPEIKRRLLEVREQRVRPGLDDKRLTAWNALLLGALAEAGAVLEEPRYGEAARACADFLLRELRTSDDRLLRTWKDGRAHLAGYLEDHAFLLEALLALYEATFEERWFVRARELADAIIERFADPERGGFFVTADDGERLIARRKDLEDQPIPAGSSSAALGLLRLAAMTGERAYEDAALGAIRLVAEVAPRYPSAFGHMLRAIDFVTAPARELAIVGEQPAALLAVVREHYRPHLVLAAAPAGGGSAVPLLEGRDPSAGAAWAYLCERFACQAPVSDPAALRPLLDPAPRALPG
jgi:uncharacterized protein YyaL (SSP411 family)